VDLFGIATSAIQTVNPNVPATLTPLVGYTTDASGHRTPTPSTPQSVLAQVQPLQTRDLRQVEGLNLNGTMRKIYLRGIANATVRVSGIGGELVTLTDGPNAGIWAVVQVLEQWETWVSVVVTLQNGS
jgi:hypothetical protein